MSEPKLASHIPSMETLHGSLVSFDQETKTGILKFECQEHFCNPHGGVQGGFLAAMLDDVCGLTCFAGTGRMFTTGTMHVDFLHGARPGDTLIATGSIVRVGKRQAIIDGVLQLEGDDKIIARATCHQVFLDTDIK